MSLSVVIGGVEKCKSIIDNSIVIERGLTYIEDICSMQAYGFDPIRGSEVVIVINGVREFAGVITDTVLVDYSHLVYDVKCGDYTNILDKKLVVESYENQAADVIFKDIAAKYCTDFTVNGVLSGSPIIESISFNYLRPSECFKALCSYVGWQWQPDYFKDLKFFNAENLGSPAPLNLTSSTAGRFVSYQVNMEDLRNKIYIVGGTMLSDLIPIEWTADGVSTVWPLPWKPTDYSLLVNEVPMTVGIENQDEEGVYDYLVNLTDSYLKCDVATAPTAGQTIRFISKQDVEVITIAEDIPSQEALAAIVPSTDGIYEHVISDNSLNTIEAATAAGDADLRAHCNPTVKGIFEIEQVTADVNTWSPGQIVQITWPDYGINNSFLIQKVSISFVEGFIDKLSYRVEYGGRLLGIEDFLKALVSTQQQKSAINTSILHKIAQVLDGPTVSDDVTSAVKSFPYLVEASQIIAVFGDALAYSETTQVDFQSGSLTNVVATSGGTLELSKAYDANTKALLHMDGANDGTTFTDEIGHTVTVGGGACTKTGTKKWGTAAGYFNGTDAFIKLAASSDWNFGTGDFTYEIQSYFLGTPSPGDNYMLYDNYLSNGSGNGIQFCLYNDGGTLKLRAWCGLTLIMFAWTPTLSTWYHLVYTRVSGQLRFYVEGSQVGTDVASIDNITLTSATHIGCRYDEAGRWFYGYLDEPKISNNARWTTGFTPPTAAYDAVYSSSGTRIKIVDISGAVSPNENSIEWIATVPADTALTVEAALSIDGGSNYGDYISCTSGAAVVALFDGADLSNARLKIKETLSTNNTAMTPQLSSLNFSVSNKSIATVGGLLSITQPGSEVWGNPQYMTSVEGVIWTDWTTITDLAEPVEVPYPGYVRVKGDSKLVLYNWKIPFDDTQTVCSFVEVS